jgi:hypothetical protein
MHIRHLGGALILGTLIQACSTVHTVDHPAGYGTRQTADIYGSVSSDPEASPEMDHFIAWVPRHMAPTATVARAMAQVEWGNAKEQAGASLCDGAWLVNGEVTGRSGPYPATAPDRLGGYAAWYYRVSHKPGVNGCAAITTWRIYTEIRSNLPRWIDIRTAMPPDTFIASQQVNAMLAE